MNKLILAATISLCITGCSTPADLRKNPAEFVVKSTKNSKSVAICISEKWENAGHFGITLDVAMRPTASGHTVRLLTGNTTSFLVDVDDTDEGSTSNFYLVPSIGTGQFKVIVIECQ